MDVKLKILADIAMVEIDEKSDILDVLEDMINWTCSVDQLDLSGFEPMFMVSDVLKHNGLQNLREDHVSENNHKQQILDLAPEVEGNFISVPKIIE